MKRQRLVFIINDSAFFVSHRLPIAAAAVKAGYEVYVLSPNCGLTEKIEKVGAIYHEIPLSRSFANPIRDINSIFSIAKWLKSLKPSVIHNITLKTAMLSSIAAKLSGQKNVINAISGFGYAFTDGRKKSFKSSIRFLLKIAFKSKSFSIIVQNPDDFDIVKKMKLVPDSHLYLIKGSGVDLDDFSFVPQPNNPICRIIFPARLLKDKGIYEFVSAAKLLKNKLGGKAEFVLAGKLDIVNPMGVTEEEVDCLIDGEYIKWVGYCKNMKQEFSDSDIVVLPSYREGLPKALIEACAIGRPIVTTDAIGCRETVVDGYNGFLVPVKNIDMLAEKILVLVEDPSMRVRMGNNSRLLAEREFSLQDVVGKHLQIYSSVIENQSNE